MSVYNQQSKYCVFCYSAKGVNHAKCPPTPQSVRGQNYPCGIVCYRVPGWEKHWFLRSSRMIITWIRNESISRLIICIFQMWAEVCTTYEVVLPPQSRGSNYCAPWFLGIWRGAKVFLSIGTRPRAFVSNFDISFIYSAFGKNLIRADIIWHIRPNWAYKWAYIIRRIISI